MRQVIHNDINRQKNIKTQGFSISLRGFSYFLVGVVVISYLLFHSMEGKRGVYVLNDLEIVLEQEELVLASLLREKARLEEARFYLNHPQDYPDFIDEKIRKNLGYIYNNEKVILFP